MIEVLREEMFGIVNNDIISGVFNELDICGFYDNEMWLDICERKDIDIDDYGLEIELDNYIDGCSFWENPQIIEK
jgi:hypothetical protein